eukprot:scaffold56_cov390-Pavlova_lutheri.AAC.11
MACQGGTNERTDRDEHRSILLSERAAHHPLLRDRSLTVPVGKRTNHRPVSNRCEWDPVLANAGAEGHQIQRIVPGTGHPRGAHFERREGSNPGKTRPSAEARGAVAEPRVRPWIHGLTVRTFYDSFDANRPLQWLGW